VSITPSSRYTSKISLQGSSRALPIGTRLAVAAMRKMLAKRSRGDSVSSSPAPPAIRIISSTPREGGSRPTVPLPDVVPRARAKQPGRKPPPSNNSSVRGRRAATTDADDDDEYADAIDSDDDHGARRDEQANVTLAVSTSSPSSSWPSDSPSCSPQLTMAFRTIQPCHVTGTMW
jgi:hypothetical protein